MAAGHWFIRLGAVVAAALIGGLAQVAVSPVVASAAAPVPGRRVWVQGDSVLLGAEGVVHTELQGAGWTPTVTAFGGLQLSAAIGLFRQEQANLGSVVVIELGNNFCCDVAQLSAQMDEAMSAIGSRHVIWLTTALFEPRQQRINDLIRAGAARWPNAEVADWAGEVSANPQSVGADGLHLTVAGRSLLAAFILAHLDAWYGQFRGPSRPWVGAFGAAPADGPSGQQTIAGLPTGVAASAGGRGYWVAASDGSVEAEGDAQVFAGARGALGGPVVGIAATPDGGGYWLVTSEGNVLASGDAILHGSAAAIQLNQPVVGMAVTPDGGGYWLASADGGVFTFGDARFFGSMGAVALNQPIVSIGATPDGRGYWLVAADGGVFTFGDARFEGSAGAMHLNHPVESMAPTADGKGYWLVAADGGVFTFGDARLFGPAAIDQVGGPSATYVAIASAPGGGFWLLAREPA